VYNSLPNVNWLSCVQKKKEKKKESKQDNGHIPVLLEEDSSGGGSTESQYLSKSTNNQINISFSKSRSNTMTTILK